nr:hypothetical protein [uncultured Albidiferax sp.]
MKKFHIADVVNAVMSLDGASSLAPRQVSTAIQLALRQVIGLSCLGGSDLAIYLENGYLLRCSVKSCESPEPLDPDEAKAAGAAIFLKGWEQYQKAQVLTQQEWFEFFKRHLEGETFDEMLDAYPPKEARPVEVPSAAPPKFPVALRKMWSGGEVQQWIDANWPKGGAA